jgi:CxxC motif-containing protein (DUF1111 family)
MRRVIVVVLLAGGITSAVVLGQGGSHFRAADPGPRPDPASLIPDPLPGLNENEAALFQESLLRVSELEGSCETCAQQPQGAHRSTIFAGEAYNVEMGISNDEFPIGRSEDADCDVVYEPFDVPRTDSGPFNNPLKIMPAWIMFAEFMRFVDVPRPVPLSASAQHGKQLFAAVGCALCHTPSFQTAGTPNPLNERQEIGPHSVALRGQTVNLYSDLLLHHMGATLADNIVQGNAGPDEFRTTPLWGIGQRLFFLHDGRTNDLMVAIQDHFSRRFSNGGDNPAKDSHSPLYGPSEANAVIEQFNGLSEVDKQAILDFLRSL